MLLRFEMTDERTSGGLLGLETMICVRGDGRFVRLIRRALPDLEVLGPFRDFSKDCDFFAVCCPTDEEQEAIHDMLVASLDPSSAAGHWCPVCELNTLNKLWPTGQSDQPVLDIDRKRWPAHDGFDAYDPFDPFSD